MTEGDWGNYEIKIKFWDNFIVFSSLLPSKQKKIKGRPVRTWLEINYEDLTS